MSFDSLLAELGITGEKPVPNPPPAQPDGPYGVDKAHNLKPIKPLDPWGSVKGLEGDAQAQGLNPETKAIYSENADHDVVITDVRHAANDFTVGFSSADPVGSYIDTKNVADNGAVDMQLLFDPQALRSGSSVSGELAIQLMDIRAAFDENKPLKTNPYDGIKFKLDGKDYTLKFGKVNGDATYDDLFAALQKAITESKIPVTIEKDGMFDRTDPKELMPGHKMGVRIVLKADGQFSDANWTLPEGAAPASSDYSTDLTPEAATDCALIETNIVLDNVGRVNWDLCNRLPVYGSNGGYLQVGSMADRGGVEKFNVTLERGSWLESLKSTNDALKEIVVTTPKDAEGKAKFGAQNLYIGTDLVADRPGLDYTDLDSYDAEGNQLHTYIGNNGMDNLTMVPSLLEGRGLVNVRDFDAADMTGNVNLHAVVDVNAFAKYFGNRDFQGIDFDQNADKTGKSAVHNPVFDYTTGSGDDGVNMEVSGYVAADRDFAMNINTGAGNDRVQFQFTGFTPYSLANQKSLHNVKIDTGEGNDVVELPGAGDVWVDLGAGNDVVYTDNTGAGSVFVLHRTADAGVQQAPKKVLPLGADVLADDNLSHGAGVDNAGDAVSVVISFLGLTIEGKAPYARLDGNGNIATERLNQLIIDTIEQDHEMSHLLDARDGSGQSLLIESLIAGGSNFKDLSINFKYGAPGTNSQAWTPWADVNSFYNGDTTTGAGTQYTQIFEGGVFGGDTDNVINPGTGRDLVVLSSHAESAETIIMNGVAEDILTVVNFNRANDQFISSTGQALTLAATPNAGTANVYSLHTAAGVYYDKVILANNIGTGSITPSPTPSPGGEVAVTKDSPATIDVSGGNIKLVFADGKYDKTVSGFGEGDVLDGTAIGGGFNVLPDTDQTDGEQQVQFIASDSSQVTVTLVGLTAEQDAGIFNKPSFLSVFGDGSVLV